MSIKDFNEAVQILENYKNELYNITPQEEIAVSKAEIFLNLKFPHSYKVFLKLFGCLDFRSQEIYGLFNNSIIRKTIYERQNYKDPVFPRTLIVIHELGNGELSCLDTSQMNEEGECPVVAWYFGAKLPNGKYEILAEDFGAFLLEKVKWALETLKEDEKNN